MSWPEESTLRAILGLKGVAGTTRNDIEFYLDSVEEVQRANRYDRSINVESPRFECLRRNLNHAVTSHWHQLLDAKAV